MIKAVIFDLDGTLLDTSRDICAVLNESLGKFGLPQISLNDTVNFIGNGAKKLIERAVADRPDMVEEVYSDYSVRFPECSNNLTVLYEGERETLVNLKNAGIELCILSNKPQRATERVYAKLLAEFKFSIVLGQTEHYPLKPDPASTIAILRQLGIKSEECLFVGDGETDVLTARAAGIKCVSVLWGYRSKSQLAGVGSTFFAHKFSDLEKFVLP